MPESSRNRTSSGESASVQTCPNCGRSFSERFCNHCGQSDRDYRGKLRPVAGEFLRETFEGDSRLYRTLELLLFKPGSLTREFSRNRRASYVSPVRLYLFASFLFFLALSLSGSLDTVQVSIPEPDLEVLESQRLDEEGIEAFKAALPEEYRGRVDQILDRPDGDPMKETILSLSAMQDPREMSPVDRFFLLGTIDLLHDPEAIGRRFISNMPIAMFFLLPCFALALSLCYHKRRRFFVEHLVFAMHVQSFSFVIYTLAVLVTDDGWGAWFRLACTLAPYPYLLVALRRYYEDGWVRTALKSIGVGMLYSLALAPAFVIAMFVTG